MSNYNYGEIPFQNTVQNVQNQIIQENMQQNQNMQQKQNYMCNQQSMLVNNLNLQQNLQNLDQGLKTQSINVPMHGNLIQTSDLEHIIQQNQLQSIIPTNNHAMPQEPRKIVLEQTFTNMYKQPCSNFSTQIPVLIDAKQYKTESLSPDHSSQNLDVSQNLNDAFCLPKNDGKTQNLNENYNKTIQAANLLRMQNSEISVITNNATYNDDSLLEFLIDSPTPSENDIKSKDTAVNTDNIPHAPLRKKKVEKLEQLMLNAINSQNEVVNKVGHYFFFLNILYSYIQTIYKQFFINSILFQILAAQNDMVTRFLDIDRDRQNRLENRLDDLLKVVHASMLTKQTSETEIEIPPPLPEPTITSLAPPPKPGAPPPKLDLVPPKPCRVPCTMPNSNIELIAQNTIVTKPGIVSPISSPIKKPGTIWSKLGPVSQSPFVKAQQRLGLQSVASAEIRTQSSAERRIAKEMERAIDTETLIFETKKFLEIEKKLEEKIENARLETTLSQNLHARRRLFTQREPTAAMILTAAFLENECRTAEQLMSYYDTISMNKKNLKNIDDDLLAGQGESYEHLRQLNIKTTYISDKPCDTSTPAKLGIASNNNEKTSVTVPKQTIQQLAQLLMNAGRWKNVGIQNEQQNLGHTIQSNIQKHHVNAQSIHPSSNEVFTTEKPKEFHKKNDQNHIGDRILNKYEDPTNAYRTTYGSSYNTINQKSNYPISFIKSETNTTNLKQDEIYKPIGLNICGNSMPDHKQNVRFMDEALVELQRMYIETMSKEQEMNDSLPYVPGKINTLPFENRQMIEKYIHDIIPRKQLKDNKDKDTDSDNDDEFLDTTTTMPAIPRRSSLTSTGTTSTETTHSIKYMKPDNCIIS